MENTVVFEAAENFEVPVGIVDKYLDAPELELRLILFLLRNANRSFLTDELAARLSADEKRLAQAFSFWVKAGVLFQTGGRYSVQRPKISASEIIRYSADNVAARIEGDDKIKFLYKTTEDVLKKPLTPEDASAVLSLVDWVGLPAEVAALLIQYCGEEKKGMRKIISTGIEWSEKGVDTFEKAEEYVQLLQQKKSVVGRTARMLGIRDRAITEPEKKVFLKWSEEYGYGEEMITAAYEATVQNTGKYAYAYMDKILQAWYQNGYKTAADIEKKSGEKAPKKKTERKVKLDKKAVQQLSWEILTEDGDGQGE